jgi:hypothetical protein
MATSALAMGKPRIRYRARTGEWFARLTIFWGVTLHPNEFIVGPYLTAGQAIGKVLRG